MKKILYIGNNLNNKSSNISSIHVLGLLLEREGHEIIYASSKPNKIVRLLDMVRVYLIHYKKINIVLIDTYSTQNFYYALIISQLCRLFRIDYIPILHGGNLPERLKTNPKLSRMIFLNSKCNVSPSKYLKHAFEDYGINNVIHIPNTIKISAYPFVIKNFDSPRLLWVRSFSKIYNPKLAIRVFNDIKRKYPEATLCMVGPDADGTLKEVKQLASELNLEVTFTGKLTKDDWISVSKNYNIFINTTNFDNTPVSVIEAMALGLPIVSTNVGGMPYLIENNKSGILVEPDNVESMVNAIRYVMENKNSRQVCIENARQKAETFDWGNIKKLWYATLEQDNCLNIT